MNYFVEVVHYGTRDVVRKIPCGTNEQKAEKAEVNVMRGIDQDKFYTRIVPDPPWPEIRNGEIIR